VRVSDIPLAVVDGCRLDAETRTALQPDEVVHAADGTIRRMPRYFFEVPSWEVARTTVLAPNFALWEFMDIDLHEAAAVRWYPRHVPCAVVLLASALSLLRHEVGQPVRIAANGGYRSPRHARSRPTSVHAWATAANIYRIGSEALDTQQSIERFAAVAARVFPALWTRPFGHGVGEADDHLHVDLGYVTQAPR
jgi:hypothetical protein